MKLRKCLNHAEPTYTLKEICEKCNEPTKDAHYKFIKIKSIKNKISKQPSLFFRQ